MLYDLCIVAHIQHLLACFSARPPLAVDTPSINPPCQLPLVVRPCTYYPTMSTSLVIVILRCILISSSKLKTREFWLVHDENFIKCEGQNIVKEMLHYTPNFCVGERVADTRDMRMKKPNVMYGDSGSAVPRNALDRSESVRIGGGRIRSS